MLSSIRVAGVTMKVFRLANLVLAVLLLSWTANGYAAGSAAFCKHNDSPC